MHRQASHPIPENLRTYETRRELLLLCASTLMGTTGIAAMLTVIGWRVPAFPASHAPVQSFSQRESMGTRAERQALSTVNQETVQSYRDRYAIFGDTAHVDIELMDDVNTQQIELPRLMMLNALARIDPLTAHGDVLESYGRYKSFVGSTLEPGQRGADIALELYNPYGYHSETRYWRERQTEQRKLHQPEELFAAAIITWGLFPDAFLERYNSLPMAPTVHDRESMSGDAPLLQASWEKQLVQMTA